ncbi:MAG: M23 family metallopeptidase [Spirochaetaceae bacterium]|nr:M23 family metallopeptidase [Spirochaetaceae bacterium]
MEKSKNTAQKAALVLFLCVFPLICAGGDDLFLTISSMDGRDLGFRQYQADVENAYRRLAELERRGRGMEALLEELTVFVYRPGDNEDIFSIAARCNVPYSGIATLNRLNHPASLANAEALLLPSIPGVFIPDSPESDLEMVMASSRTQGFAITVTRNGRKESFRFLPGSDFSPTERAFFLNTSFRFPLRTYTLTSSFGPRINPVTGNPGFHGGLDLAAPLGTDIFAARDGIVSEIGEDPIYGKYIIIQHGETWVSLYGHLSTVLTGLRNSVQSGTVIGRVGSTGQSTGPHLHFELRQNGMARDPGRYLFREGNRP